MSEHWLDKFHSYVDDARPEDLDGVSQMACQYMMHGRLTPKEVDLVKAAIEKRRVEAERPVEEKPVAVAGKQRTLF